MCLIRKRESTFRLCIINNWQFSRHTKSSSTSSSSFSICCRRRCRRRRRLSASKWVHFPCGAVAIIVVVVVVAYFKCVICFVFFPARLACVRVCLSIFDDSYGIIYLYTVCCIFDRIHICRWCVYAFFVTRFLFLFCIWFVWLSVLQSFCCLLSRY